MVATVKKHYEQCGTNKIFEYNRAYRAALYRCMAYFWRKLLFNERKTPITTMVTQVYKLDELQQALNKAIEANETIKVVVSLTE